MRGCIVGWKHLKFGKLAGRDVEGMIVEAAAGALADAEVAPGDIDAIFLGTFNGGLVFQDFPASLVLQTDDRMRFKPATRVENACATGSAAVYQGLNAIAARRARLVLVVGVEKMTDVGGDELGVILTKASYAKEEVAGNLSFADLFGRIAQQYFQRYGDKSDALARIAAKNHRNGCRNPYAHLHKDLGFEFCRAVSDKNPIVSGPLRRTDCSLVSDGAAALVLADVDTALSMSKAVYFRAAQHVQDFLPMSKRDVVAFEGPERAWRQALDEAGLGLDDLSLVETHDCFTHRRNAAIRGDGADTKGRGRARHRRGMDRGRRQAAGQSIWRPQIQGPSDRRDRRVDACGGRHASYRHCRRFPGAGRPARRRLQHGGRGGRQLRLDPGTDTLRPRRMTDPFRALVLEEAASGMTASVKSLTMADLPPGDVTVAVEYSDVNYKDGMIVRGTGRLVRQYPHVPGIDFAGTVELSQHPDYRPGDKVILTGWRVGEVQWGGYAQMARRQWRLAGASARRSVDSPGDGHWHRRFYRDVGGRSAGEPQSASRRG